MTLLEMIKKHSASGGEEAMWKSVEAFSKYAERTKDEAPDAYTKLKKCIHEEMCGPHYDEDFATEDVEGIAYTDATGKAHIGAHWTKDEVCDAWATRTFDESVTCWDKWVAANAMYADLCKAFKEDEVLEAAYLFFFADEDYEGTGKVWEYFEHLK